MARSVQVFFNERSGRPGRQQAQEIAKIFAEEGCACEVISITRNLDLAAHLRRSPESIAVACGGDGTISTIANTVAHTGNTLGVLPQGTLNHFARDLGIPFDLRHAIHLVATGEPQAVDVAEVNGRIFVNNSSLGAYPSMVMDRERLKHSGWNKWISLLWATSRAFVRFRLIRVDLTVHGESRHYTTPFVFVGNNEYATSGTQIGTRQHLCGGRLFLYLAPGATRLGILRLTLAALLGRAHTVPEFHVYCVEEFSVHVRGRRIRVALDGEVRHIRGPLRYRILPGGLQVIHPPAAQQAAPPEAESAPFLETETEHT